MSKPKQLLSQFISIALFLSLIGCASADHVVGEYNEYLKTHKKQPKSSRTVILFLVDGLSVPLLVDELESGHLPEIQNYFIADKKSIYQARTTFPSLTYPAIGSLLSQRSIEDHGIYGNSVFQNGEIVNFEDPQNFVKADNLIDNKNIFSRLADKGLKTISYDYSFVANSSVHLTALDGNAAAAILQKNYLFVDQNILSSLAELLKKTDVEQWPDFIYVHLVGIDFTSHDHGQDTYEVRDYLQKLDALMKNVFSRLQSVEQNKKRQIVSILTADHGFDQNITRRYLIDEKLRHENIRYLNEGRYLALFFPEDWSQEKRQSFLRDLSYEPEIDLTVARFSEQLEIRKRKEQFSFQYVTCSDAVKCPQQQCGGNNWALKLPTPFDFSKFARSSVGNDSGSNNEKPQVASAAGGSQEQIAESLLACADRLPEQYNQKFYPFFVSNVSHYFRVDQHPDAVVIAKPGVSFREDILGQHGGPTERETFTPLLMRGADLKLESGVPPIWRLLDFLTAEGSAKK